MTDELLLDCVKAFVESLLVCFLPMGMERGGGGETKTAMGGGDPNSY